MSDKEIDEMASLPEEDARRKLAAALAERKLPTEGTLAELSERLKAYENRRRPQGLRREGEGQFQFGLKIKCTGSLY